MNNDNIELTRVAELLAAVELSKAQEVYLSTDEVRKMTGYARPGRQMAVLKSLGIPARRRPDNTVLVMRMHCTHQAAAPNEEPKLKSQRR